MSGRRLKVIVEADGGSRGNPGPAGYGTVVCEAATGEVLLARAESIGVATNNVAEYRGLVAGLRAAADLGAVDVEVRMDSKLVVEQMAGRWQIKHAGLRSLAAQAAELVRRFDTVRFTWIPRERNRRADALANAAMDGRPLPDVDSLADPPEMGRSTDRAAGVEPAPRGGSAAAQPAARAGSAQLARGGPAGVKPSARGGSAGVEPAMLGRSAGWSPPTQAACRLLLVRHGETERTAQRRYSGRADTALSARGLAQARAVAARVAAMAGAASAVLTSPLSRCTATAAEIARALGDVPVEVDEDLVECDFGEWDGLTFDDVRQRWPQELERWLASPAQAPPGGESFDAVAARVRRATARIVGERADATVVVVSHVSPIKLVLRDVLSGGDSFLQRLYLDPAGLSIVDIWPDGGVAVRTVNDTAHLA